MPISCHFQDCKALLVLKKHVRSTIASTWTLPFTFTFNDNDATQRRNGGAQTVAPKCPAPLQFSIENFVIFHGPGNLQNSAAHRGLLFVSKLIFFRKLQKPSNGATAKSGGKTTLAW